jgi:pimeloyl-ACP methyl ester carboxylesterase
MSDHIGYQPTIADYARCVTEVADGIGLKQFVVLGEATGSGVSIELAGQYPDRIAKAVLVNCPYHPEPVRSDDLLAPFKINRPEDETGFPVTRTIEFMLSKEARQVPMHPTQEWMDRINTAMIEAGRDRWHALTALSHYDVGAGLSRVRCPTLFLTGEFFYFAQSNHQAVALVPGARAHVLKDRRFCAGWEAAREIAAHVRTFIA